MMAPTMTIAGTEWIPAGDAGTRATVARMVQIARTRSLAPAIRATAVTILRGVGGRDQLAQARLLRDWVSTRMLFLPDPTLAEGLHDPLEMLQGIARHGIVRVDCDDVAMMTAALALSVGLHARFVVVAVAPGRHYSHVWAEIGSGEQWVTVDPTRPARGVPPLVRRWVVLVG